MTESKRFGLGLIGCGTFGLFCLEAFRQLPDVRLAAVADTRRDAAAEAARKFDVPASNNPAELISRDDVDIVHIATPPRSHYELAMAAIRAGKHVLCEKPLATSLQQGEELLAAAAAAGVILPVNFVLRYNPITEALKAVIDSGVLGGVLAGRLTNCAYDTHMGPDHWFWNKDVSGGIFIEHGVHFFDLYRYWLGPGRVISAHTETRQGTCQEDRVTCEIRHESGAVASHYHGFDQIMAMDRSDHRLVCEMGDIRVAGWIPVSLSVEAAVDDEAAERLAACVPGCNAEAVERFDDERGQTVGRGRKRHVTQRIVMNFSPQPNRRTIYATSIRELLADQIAFIRDPAHARRITEQNGLDALALAEAAAKMATK